MATSALTKLTIATVAKNLFDDEVISVTLPGSEGYLTILAHHEPLITQVSSGTITIKTKTDEIQTIPVTAGILEVRDNAIIILV